MCTFMQFFLVFCLLFLVRIVGVDVDVDTNDVDVDTNDVGGDVCRGNVLKLFLCGLQ